mgnify:CR=1 FL=1
MIKGINRQMIEITDTGSPYFERALLVVQPDMSTADDATLHREAHEVLCGVDSCSHLRRQHRRLLISRLLLIVLSGVGGAALTLLLERLI